MTSQQLEERSKQLEARIETLEAELAQLKQILTTAVRQEEPWWLKVAGSFKDDPTFDEATRLGAEWRRSAE